MPGVADQIRKTQLAQEHARRKQDMGEILMLVKEGRLHEADERQLEVLRLALELNQLIDSKREVAEIPVASPVDSEALTQALKDAVKEALHALPVGGIVTSDLTTATSRPQMKHTSLTDFTQAEDEVVISHADDLGEIKEGESGAEDKLAKLKRLKGGGGGRS